jgi:hypothetical protein
LRDELQPNGLEVVTVALDLQGLERAGKWIEIADPNHPSLIDQEHRLDELLGVVNVPSGVWIDEEGVIVRPPEPAFPEMSIAAWADRPIPEDLDPYLRDVLLESRQIRVQPKKYVAALRDWAVKGAASQYALSPDQVVERSRPRPPEVSSAAAHFELGQHLYQDGAKDAAVAHFREAHRLQPDNWTYKRQAWSMAHKYQGPSDEYDSDWLSDVRKLGPANYYPKLDM